MQGDKAIMGDACNWMVQLEQEEECALELNDYETIVAEKEEQSNDVEIGSLDPSLLVTDEIMHPNYPTSFPLRSIEGLQHRSLPQDQRRKCTAKEHEYHAT
jgi:hypothetical protein